MKIQYFNEVFWSNGLMIREREKLNEKLCVYAERLREERGERFV